MAFSKEVQVHRIKKYADWFFAEHIQPHFRAEEEFVFPILGKEDPLIKKALADHRRLLRLFKDETTAGKSLHQIEEELDQHIRFEERVLFPRIESVATAEQLKTIAENHVERPFVENPEDIFWK
jgi:iron-sulfur cluster repair protein YtfE (RIC family)